MTGGEPFSARNGKSVSQIEASARIRQIAKESGNLEINPGFPKSTRKSQVRAPPQSFAEGLGTFVRFRHLCRSKNWIEKRDIVLCRLDRNVLVHLYRVQF